jgi:hypothetical protein
MNEQRDSTESLGAWLVRLTTHPAPYIKWPAIALVLFLVLVVFYWGVGIIATNQSAAEKLFGPALSNFNVGLEWAPVAALVIGIAVVVVFFRLVLRRWIAFARRADLTYQGVTIALDDTKGLNERVKSVIGLIETLKEIGDHQAEQIGGLEMRAESASSAMVDHLRIHKAGQEAEIAFAKDVYDRLAQLESLRNLLESLNARHEMLYKDAVGLLDRIRRIEATLDLPDDPGIPKFGTKHD